jgi:hypothetical protein
MDTALAIKSGPNVAVPDYTRPESAPVQAAVKTDLAAPDTVSAATDSNTARNDLLQKNADSQSRQYYVDPQTHEVIFRVMDTRSRQILRQVPDEAFLRMRAYARTLADGESAPTCDPQAQTDLEI